MLHIFNLVYLSEFRENIHPNAVCGKPHQTFVSHGSKTKISRNGRDEFCAKRMSKNSTTNWYVNKALIHQHTIILLECFIGLGLIPESIRRVKTYLHLQGYFQCFLYRSSKKNPHWNFTGFISVYFVFILLLICFLSRPFWWIFPCSVCRFIYGNMFGDKSFISA